MDFRLKMSIGREGALDKELDLRDSFAPFVQEISAKSFRDLGAEVVQPAVGASESASNFSTLNPVSVPERSTLILLASGLVLLIGFQRLRWIFRPVDKKKFH